MFNDDGKHVGLNEITAKEYWMIKRRCDRAFRRPTILDRYPSLAAAIESRRNVLLFISDRTLNKPDTKPSRIDLEPGAFSALQDLAQLDACTIFFISDLRLEEVQWHLQAQVPNWKASITVRYFKKQLDAHPVDQLDLASVAAALRNVQELAPIPMNIIADNGRTILFAGETNIYRQAETDHNISGVLEKLNLGDYYPVYVAHRLFDAYDYVQAEIIEEKKGTTLMVTPGPQPASPGHVTQAQWLSLLKAIVGSLIL